MITLGLILFTFIILLYSKDLELTLFKSLIKNERTKDNFYSLIVGALLFPYTLTKFFKIKKQTIMNSIKKLIPIAILAIVAIYLGSSFISVNNRDKMLRNTFIQKIDQRTAFYDKMWKIISQKSQIALKNDSSFQNIINIQVTGQKNGENVMWAWVQQSNPTATFTEVSKLYADIGRVVESEREGFYEREIDLQSVVQQHSNLVDMFPGSMIMWILGRDKLVYKPITSDQTDNVIKTGKDNNTELFK